MNVTLMKLLKYALTHYGLLFLRLVSNRVNGLKIIKPFYIVLSNKNATIHLQSTFLCSKANFKNRISFKLVVS